VGLDHPGLAICTGPKYQYPYFTDGIHLTAGGYDRLGEKYGEVYTHAVVLGEAWQPLQPASATASGNVISVRFQVLVAPFVWDDGIVPPQGVPAVWASGRGFEVTLPSGPETIASVAITGAALDTVEITCADTIEGAYASVAYAFTGASRITQTLQPDGYTYLNTTYRWGQLRDSDPFVGPLTGVPQPNYAVAFSVIIPLRGPPSVLKVGGALTSDQSVVRVTLLTHMLLMTMIPLTLDTTWNCAEMIIVGSNGGGEITDSGPVTSVHLNE